MNSKKIQINPGIEVKDNKKETQIRTNKTISKTNKNEKYVFLIAGIFMAFSNLLFRQSIFKVLKANRLTDLVNGTVLPNQTIIINGTKILEIPLKS